MKLTIYDVDHGFCARMVTPSGHVFFFDCGFSNDTTPHPIEEMTAEGQSEVQQLIISNFDEDHIRGLPALKAAKRIRSLHRNKALTPDTLRALKEEGGEISNAMEVAIDIHRSYNQPYASPDLGGVTLQFFSLGYGDFQDTNNLSLVSFVSFGVHRFIFPGDIEKAGWEKLLERQDFREALKKVTVFVASHHGRESGLCPDVFTYCKPQIVVISDKEYTFETQEVDYAPFAAGIRTAGGNRYVYTTRNDGSLFFTSPAPGQLSIDTEH